MEFPAKAPFIRKLKEHSPNSGELVGLATLAISGGVLLLLAGITLTVAVLSLIVIVPFILISSPVWIPIGGLLFVSGAGALSVLGVATAAATVISRVYGYFQRVDPMGSGGFDDPSVPVLDTTDVTGDKSDDGSDSDDVYGGEVDNGTDEISKKSGADDGSDDASFRSRGGKDDESDEVSTSSATAPETSSASPSVSLVSSPSRPSRLPRRLWKATRFLWRNKSKSSSLGTQKY